MTDVSKNKIFSLVFWIKNDPNKPLIKKFICTLLKFFFLFNLLYSQIRVLYVNEDSTGLNLVEGETYKKKITANNNERSSRTNIIFKYNSHYIFVDSSNTSGIEDGSEANPFNTIQEAIDFSINGDTILVYPGTYYESLDISSKKLVLSSLTLTTNQNSYISNTMIDGYHDETVIRIRHCEKGVVINGFTIQNGYGNGTDAGGIGIGESSNVTLMNLDVINNEAEMQGIITTWQESNSIMYNLKIMNNNQLLEQQGWGGRGVISVWDNSSVKIYNTLIAKNTNNANDRVNGVINCFANCQVYLYNSTIANNDFTGSESVFGRTSTEGASYNIVNSIVWDNIPGTIGDGVNNISFSLIEGDYVGTYNIYSDPMFVDELISDYRLSSSSPCINSGSPITDGLDLPDFDIIGFPRIIDDRIDIGAYESFIPTTEDKVYCQEDTNTYLYVPGNNIKWYKDITLDTLLFQGDTFKFEVSEYNINVNYSFYVTQSYNSNESLPAEINFLIGSITKKPEIVHKGENLLICLDSGMHSYNWYFENILFQDKHRQFLVFDNSLAGNYYVEVQNQYHCKAKSDPYVYSIRKTCNVEDIPELTIYPVPNDGSFYLNIIDNVNGPVLIALFDMTGKAIDNVELTKSKNIYELPIDFRHIPKGIYLLKTTLNKKTYKNIVIIH